MKSDQTQSAMKNRLSQAFTVSRFVTVLLFGIVWFGVHVTADFELQQKISAESIFHSKIEVGHVPFTAPFKSEPLLPPSSCPDENKIEEEGADEDTLELYIYSKRQTSPAYDCQSLRPRPLQTLDKRKSRALFVLHHSWKIFSA